MRQFFVLLCVLIVTACTSTERYHTEDQARPLTKKAYLSHHGWHTGIILEANAFPDLNSHFPSARYLEFGWGDREFYQAGEITIGMALRGLFWPTASVMHVVGFDRPPADYFINSQIIPVKMTQQGFDALLLYIHESFETPRTALRGGLYGSSLFYPANGKYHMFNTCNNWNAEGLRRAGVIESRNYPTADGLLRAVQHAQGK